MVEYSMVEYVMTMVDSEKKMEGLNEERNGMKKMRCWLTLASGIGTVRKKKKKLKKEITSNKE